MIEQKLNIVASVCLSTIFLDALICSAGLTWLLGAIFILGTVIIANFLDKMTRKMEAGFLIVMIVVTVSFLFI